MADISIVGADEFDLEEYAAVQVAAYKAFLQEKYKIGAAFMNAELYRWKYAPPAGPAKLAIARDQGSLIAVVAVVPLWIGSDNRRCLLWRAVDIATLPAARGRGLFTKLLSALRDDLGPDEVLAAFPNSNSTPGFKKIGASDASYAPFWVKLVVPGRRSRDRDESRPADFAGLDPCWLLRLFSRPGVSRFVRDPAYLHWRYASHPTHSYQLCSVDEGEDAGLIVFRESGVYGRRVLLILEWWASSPGAAARTMASATDYCRQHGIRYVVTVGNAWGVGDGLRHLLVPVPRRLAPKEQVLRGFARGETAQALFFNDWTLQMGDLPEF